MKTPKKKRKVTVGDRQSSTSDLVSKFFQRSASFARTLRGSSKGSAKKVFVSGSAVPSGDKSSVPTMDLDDGQVPLMGDASSSASSSIVASTELASSVSSRSSSSQSKRLHRGNELSELKPSYSCTTLPRGVHLNRLSIFSRHNSPFFAPMIADEAGWVLEIGSPRVTTLDLSTSSSAVSPRSITAATGMSSMSVSDLARVNDTDTWYSSFFQGAEHSNWLGVEATQGPVSISVMRDGDLVRAIVRTEKIQEKIALPVSMLMKGGSALLKKDKRALLKSIIPPGWHLKTVREVKETKHIDELLMFEKNEVQTKFKWGVLYVKHGQKEEDAMFANNKMSPRFVEFLEALGDKVALKDFEGYNGGLDTTKNATGTHSIYTQFNEFEIMYHVAPMLPHDPACTQQLERKRHLGNDVVVIVFVENDNKTDSLLADPPAYLPTTIRTHFQHVLAVVQRDPTTGPNEKTRYRLHVSRKGDVPTFGPQLPSPAVFDKSQLRNVLLTKLINGERAALKAPSFERAISRTRSGFIQYYQQEYPKK